MEDKEIEEMKTTILLQVYKSFEEVQDFVRGFEEYKHIWLTDKTACLKYFAKSGEIRNQQELELIDESSDLGANQKPASLEMFKEQVKFIIR